MSKSGNRKLGFATHPFLSFAILLFDIFGFGFIAHMLLQQPGNQSIPASGGGISSPAVVSTGLIGQCSLTETSGTTVSCGTAGNGTLPAYPNTPSFTSSSLGTITAMDSFTAASFNANGNWSAQSGTLSVGGTGVMAATAVPGNSRAFAVYTGNPTSGSLNQNQWAQATVGTAGTTGWFGVCLHCSPTVVTGYVCEVNASNVANILQILNGSIVTLATTARASLIAGDTLACSIKEGVTLPTSRTINEYVNGVLVQSTTDSTAIAVSMFNGQPGIQFAFTNPTSPTVKNFLTGTLDPNISGGLLFGAGQFVTLPTSLNASQTIQVFACYQYTSQNRQDNALVMGTGGSTNNGVWLAGDATAATMAGHSPHVFVIGNGSVNTVQAASPNGCALTSVIYGNSTLTPPSLDRVFINGLETGSYASTSRGSSNVQVGGNYQLGGTVSSPATSFTGTMYYALFYNRALSPSEIQQNNIAVQSLMQSRGVTSFLSSNDNCDALVAFGDSQTSGSGLASPTTQGYTQNLTLFTPANSNAYCNSNTPWNQAVGGGSAGAALAPITPPGGVAVPDIISDPFYTGNGVRNTIVMWIGTNDLLYQGSTGVGANILMGDVSNYIRARNLYGWSVIFVDIISRGSGGACTFDTNKDVFNPLVRQYWSALLPSSQIGFVDLASDPAFADGGCTGVAFNADNIHPSAHGHINLIAPRVQREINAVWGNRDFSTANTYTTTSTAATATTAGSESGNTVTLTMAATQPWPKGACVIVAGVTPAGYNSAANQCWLVTTSSSTQITYFNPTSGLGAVSVQGTVQAPQELDQDVYAILGGSATTPNHILQTCLGRTGHTVYRMFTNTASNWTITSQFGENINGGATFTGPTAPAATNHPVVALKAILTSNTAGGCSWQASLQ